MKKTLIALALLAISTTSFAAPETYVIDQAGADCRHQTGALLRLAADKSARDEAGLAQLVADFQGAVERGQVDAA